MIENKPCGCTIDHDKGIIDPCKKHVTEVLLGIAWANGGKIHFAKQE